MTMIDALQIDCVELTGPTSGQGVMHLNSYHAQPQGYLNGGATLAFGEVLSGMLTAARSISCTPTSTESVLEPLSCGVPDG